MFGMFSENPFNMAMAKFFTDSTMSMIRTVRDRYPHLTVKRERELVDAWRLRGNLKAKEELVLSHMNLLVKMVRDLSGYRLSPDDLLGQAFQGIEKAVAGFDPDRGFRFNTFARAWIKESMMSYVMANMTIVRAPQTVAFKMMFFHLSRLRAEMDLKGPLTEEMAERVKQRLSETVPSAEGISAQSIMDADCHMRSVFMSADTRYSSEKGEGSSLLDNLVSPDVAVDEAIIDGDEDSYRRQVLTEAMEVLNPRQKDIFVQRKIAEPMVVLDALAVQYGVSRERIRQIENRSMVLVEDKVKALLAERADEAARRVQSREMLAFRGSHACAGHGSDVRHAA